MSTGDIVLYDGECGLCDRFVSFVLARDGAARFRFAAQQGAEPRRFLEQHGHDVSAPLTVVVRTADGRLLVRSEAVLHVVRQLGGLWWLAGLGLLVPRILRDFAYDQIAKRRLRWFGKVSCRIPTPRERARFLADDEPLGAPRAQS